MYILWKLCAKNMVENLPVGKKWHLSRIRYKCIHFLTDGPNLAGWTVTKAPNSGVYTIFTTTIIIITIIIVMTIITMSYAALQASNLDWIVGPGNSSGGYILGCSQCLASCLRHSAQIGPDLLCHCSFWSTRILLYFPLSALRLSVTGVTYQLFSIIWWFRPWKPYIFWMHLI